MLCAVVCRFVGSGGFGIITSPSFSREIVRSRKRSIKLTDSAIYFIAIYVIVNGGLRQIGD
jgi:hypothetical protein